MPQRTDARLIRHLTKVHGTDTAAEWQRPPLVLFPSQEFAHDLLAHTAEFQTATPVLDKLLWQDVLFDLPWARRQLGELAGLPDRGQSWLRVRSLDRLLPQTAVTSPWLSGPVDLLAPFRAEPGRWLAVEAWDSYVQTMDDSGESGFPYYPDVTLIDRRQPWDLREFRHLYPNQTCRGTRAFGAGFCNLFRCIHPNLQLPCVGSEIVMVGGAHLAVLILAYLLQSDEYPVEVRDVKARSPKDVARDPKPWTREDLTHIILIDPHRVSDYRPAAPGGGSHASPRPHQRRGHWRQLRAERFRERRGTRVWVRQAWVGEEQWEHGGQRYRLVTEVMHG